MVIRQPAYAFASSYVPRQRPGRAKSVAIGASIVVHILLGAYVLTAVVEPMKIQEPGDATPVTTAPIITLPVTGKTVVAPPDRPHTVVHAAPASTVTPAEVLPLTPQRTLTVDPPKIAALVDPAPTGAGAPPKTVQHVIINPSWLSRPNGDQLAQAYPERAARLGIAGSVVLDCRVLASGAVGTCDVISETPADQGFAKAALSLGHLFRMKPRTEDGQAVDGGTIRIPVRFTIADG